MKALPAGNSNLPAVLERGMASVQVAGLPASLDAEVACLGAILLDNSAYYAVAELLVSDDFSNDGHRRIFARMVALAKAGKPIDPVTLTDELLRTTELNAAGGVAYLAQLTEGLPRSTNAAHYARIVKDKAVLRRLIHTANAIMREALDGAEDTGALLDRAESAILAIGDRHVGGGLLPFGEAFNATYRSMDEMVSRTPGANGLATGFALYDSLTGGLHPQELTIIAARPSQGKTALALTMASHIATHSKETVAFFSLEMSKQAIIDRLVCAEARVDSHKFRMGWLNREEIGRLMGAMRVLFDSSLHIDDTAPLRLQELHAKARRLQQKHGLAVVVIDYLGKLTPPKAENRNQEVAALVRGIKDLAKNLNVPVVLLSQLSRRPEGRGGEAGGHRPLLSDLRESGEIEQEADVVAFIHRDEYYYRMQGREVPDEIAGRAELIVGKQRNGPTDKVPLVFLEKFVRFDNMAEGF